MKSLGLLRSLFAVALLVGTVAAAGFSPGNLVVYRVGDGATALASTGAKVFLDEFTTTGTLVQSVELNSTGAGGKLIASGTATSEGNLAISPNGQFITLTGYNATIPTTGLTTTAGATVQRVVGVATVATGAVDLSTLLTDFASGNTPRSAVTNDGDNLWLTGGSGGVRFATKGSTTSTQLSTTVTNLRQLAIFDDANGNDQLYASASSGAIRLGSIGAGLPTASGETITNLPGFPTVGSPYGFFLADLDAGVAGPDTLYVADDGASALTKYSLVNDSWDSNGLIGENADDYRGITGSVSGTTVNLYATRKGGSGTAGGGELVSILDNTGYNPTAGAFSALTPTVLASALTGQMEPAANTSFRGVVLIPGGGGGGPSGVAGDYNNNGAVGPEDYSLWSNSFGNPITGGFQNVNPAKAGTTIDASDYTYWRDRMPGAAAALAPAVPEPASLILAALPLAALSLRHRNSAIMSA